MGELPFIDHIFPLGGPEHSEVPVRLYGVNLPQNTHIVQTGGNAPNIKKIMVGRGAMRSNTRPFAVGLLSEVTEKEPNDLPFQAQEAGKPIIINGRIDHPGDVDCFRFDAQRGEPLEIEVLARRLDSPLDARLVLLDPEEHILAVSDDAVDRGAGLVTHHADSLLNYKLPATGRYVVRIDDLQGKGGPEAVYRLRISRKQPDYSLRVIPSSLNIPKEGNAVITVHALRKAGFDGPIKLSIKDEPFGIELNTSVIPRGKDKTRVTLSAAGRRLKELMVLEIEGEAKIGSRTVRRTAVPADDQMQAFLWRHLVPAQELLVRVTPPEPASVELDLPYVGFVKVRPGRKVIIPAKVHYEGDASGYVRVELSGAPEWVTLKTKNLNGSIETDSGKRLIFEISEEAPPGEFEALVLTGKIYLNKSEDDISYNPLSKWSNKTTHKFTIGAIPLKISE